MKFDQEYTEILAAKNLYRGWKESPEVNSWLSEIFEMNLCLIRAEKDRFLTMNSWRLPTAQARDRRSAFITDGAIHLINRKSCTWLERKVKEKYEENEIENLCVDDRTFRPNFVIDHGAEFQED